MVRWIKMALALRWMLPAWLMVLAAGPAQPHAMPGSAVLLDFQRGAVGAELQLPLDQLQLAYQAPLLDDPATLVARQRQPLQAYLLAHIHPVAPDGRPWQVTVRDMAVTPATAIDPVELRAHLWLVPPAGAPLRQLVFNYDVMTHALMTHTVMVYARNDWNNAVFADRPELLGTIRWVVKRIAIDRDAGSFWSGLANTIALGGHHIAEGTDHLLFLLTLLLAAPLARTTNAAGARRWGPYAGWRPTLRRLLALVTAFTIGHSLTLVLGAFGGWVIPQKPVEALIALSILFSALHAWRPLFRGRETWIAAGFGLIHGLSFAAVLAAGAMDGWHKASAIFGFNFGIELVQLAVVALVVPWLVLLARAGCYTGLRTAGAALAAVASLAWLVERLTERPNPLAASIEAALAYAPQALAMLALVSVGLTIWKSRSALAVT